VGKGTHGEQTARALTAYEAICIDSPAALCVVVGDVNTTFACALAANKTGVPVAHLESGLRSYDRTMPEEINRVLTDSISDILWTPSTDANENLFREGVPAARVKMVGNIMIDTLVMMQHKIVDAICQQQLIPNFDGITVTFHRPANVDSPAALTRVVNQILAVSELADIAFPVHPRTRMRLQEFGLERRIASAKGVTLLPPLGYLDFMGLVTRSRLVITDSGGVQEETSFLGVPCITARESTERPITVSLGTNQLCPINQIFSRAVDQLWKPRRSVKIPLWDGITRHRVAAEIHDYLNVPI
jgi:UDP-N-acetylglucosamine 2-epimerase (non-hydrolysing)